MDRLDDFIAEHMPTYGVELGWRDRLALMDEARNQSDLTPEQYVIRRLRELAAVKAA